MANNITIAKGGISVEIQVERVEDNFSNTFFIIKPVQSTDNQGDGPKEPKIVDLLKITHQIIIKGHITSTATKTTYKSPTSYSTINYPFFHSISINPFCHLDLGTLNESNCHLKFSYILIIFFRRIKIIWFIH